MLLDKTLTQAAANKDYVSYTGKKIMDRLRIMAAHTPRGMDPSDPRSVTERGANIFLTDEPDVAHAKKFLV